MNPPVTVIRTVIRRKLTSAADDRRQKLHGRATGMVGCGQSVHRVRRVSLHHHAQGRVARTGWSGMGARLHLLLSLTALDK